VEALKKSFTVIAFDLPGHGRSPVANDGDYSFESMSQDIVSLLNHVGVPRASVVGISIGGEIAQVFAAKFPERVDKLVLCSTACYTSPQRAAVWQERIAAVADGGMSEIASGAADRWFTPQYRAANPHVVDNVRRRLTALDPDVYTGLARTIQKMDLRPLLRKLNCSTLVICGDQDGNTGPDVAAMIAQCIPGAKLAVLAGVGHFPNLEAPASFERLLLDALTASP
jgi:3-oxoadipate enol-lactonase